MKNVIYILLFTFSVTLKAQQCTHEKIKGIEIYSHSKPKNYKVLGTVKVLLH